MFARSGTKPGEKIFGSGGLKKKNRNFLIGRWFDEKNCLHCVTIEDGLNHRFDIVHTLELKRNKSKVPWIINSLMGSAVTSNNQ